MDVPVLEVGGSHVTAAVVSPDGWRVEVVERIDLASQQAAEQVVGQLADAARKLPGLQGLAIAIPGPFDYEAGIGWYQGQTKFDALYGFELGAALRAELGLERLEFVNDAEAFAVGEWTAGPTRGAERCAGVTVGTGIGTAFLADGYVVRTGGTVPPGGELYRTQYDGRPLEDSISGRALLRAYFDRTGVDEPGIGVKQIADRARAGDGTALDSLRAGFTVLAEALTPWIDRFAVTRTVLGGSISGAFDLVHDVFPFEVVATRDTEHAALIGAAAHSLRTP
ncbi:ROK family protein [Kribbella sandramycini]|uniref:Glucokinase n=1 Tax=Kribbella sandramycini TaxID=60450 RepID=A0A7Y4L4N1_9ACTN|nr:ROK family protein [Kribbella sandramycini]MBB6571665.1 glucokinase [Kribbella sandramycini]NOL44310.1 ROK family protein [Kribbella sandramycini]